ncbi:LANO_0F10572g1_1 [Lachancea nothofagi CBS 11611]|uniref:LANO_0F10572g1_1 n=1 Tax=Lachancea nothofagi CBS 11611 TaxID=1266666 RepID=A0A1G4KAE8_9SACH|nr:LANO_0F10572g1_1 [Lachancea nothofagi CBS 11611]
MIRRLPTAISLTPEDLIELEEELEEFKLQREIKAQQRNLRRSATVVADQDDAAQIPAAVRNTMQESPLKKEMSHNGSSVQRPLSQSFNGVVEGPSTFSRNPFYTER